MSSGSEEGTGDDAGEAASAAVRNALAVSGCGCLLSPVVLLGAVVVIIIIGGFGVILAPLIALITAFGGGGGGGGGQPSADDLIAVFQGDGKGELDPAAVPADLVDPIQKAGALCDAIGPTVIAAQIERESNYNRTLVGPDGAQGISQLPPAVFARFGEDEDGNGKTSALDPADSIVAQGRFLCDLAGQAQQLIDSGAANGSVLDLALVGYDQGLDAVRQAQGVPKTNEAQGYVAGVRALLAKYEGLVTPPPTTTSPPAPPPAAATPAATPAPDTQ
ncbi:lytic transglycosylase domain-containing protein [Streptomyces sp. NPDC048278]|uniref:lytic transglycosylase domain-containing protein n=1 Tax=Streptomyces sp. NPDC048278 TaxID=3155809 RepID=UPI0034246FB5